MSTDPRLQEAIRLIEQCVADAYVRGRADAIDAMIKAASGAKQQAIETPAAKAPPIMTESTDDDGRKRAPRGSAERVIRRAIEAAGDQGASVSQMMDTRQGELEMMLVDSSIRGELRRGEKMSPQKYVEIDGRWFIDPV